MDKDRMPFGKNNRQRRKTRPCAFCSGALAELDYKNIEFLRRYVTEHGRIRPRRQTGVCAKHQRQLAIEIKRARHIALLPFIANA